MFGYGIDLVLIIPAMLWVIIPPTYNPRPSKECIAALNRFGLRMRPTSLKVWCHFYESKKVEMGMTDEQFVSWLDENLPANWETWHRENQARIGSKESNL